MKSKIFSLFVIASLFAISCNKDVEFDGDEFSLETRSLINDCFELVFPVSFISVDGDVTEVNSPEELESLKTRNRGKFKLVYPVEIIDSNGDLITVEDHAQMQLILKDCGIDMPKGKGKNSEGKNGFDKGKNKHFNAGWDKDHNDPCFEIVFPVTINFPDGTFAEMEDKEAMHNAWSTWKKENPKTKGGPEFQYPIQILMDGETAPVTVSSKEELQTIRKNC
jgi:hypothetical protein